MRRIWAAGTLSCVAIGACQLDSRNLSVQESRLAPGGKGAEDGLLVQPSSTDYGPITLGFAASARFLVENAGTTALEAPSVLLDGGEASPFILTQNDCIAALSSGVYCTVAVAFRPRDLEARDAMLTISGSERRFDISLSGSGLEPGRLLLRAAPGSEALFGDVPLQGEQEATLQLVNPTDTSAGPIERVSNNAAFRLVPPQGGECASSGAQLVAGQSCNFRVRFAPVLRGVTDATITARSPSLGSVSIGVSGRALAPARLFVDPPRLAFGDVLVAGAAVLDLAVSNVGDESLPPVESSVTGAAASDFRVSGNGCSTPLLPRETCSVAVSFSPRATGPHSALLRLDAGVVGSIGVDLSGTGLPANNLLVAAAEGGDFGSVAIGSESQRAVRISNPSSEASGPITLAVNSGDFSIEPPEGSECSSGVTNLAGGAGCDVRVRFSPTQRSQRNATLTVSSVLGGAALNLSGVGLAKADLRVDDALDFGGISQGVTAIGSVTIANPGEEPTGPLSARVSGFDAASFYVQSNGCMGGLDAQGSCVVAVAFAPATMGSQLATLTLQDELGDTHEVTLSGMGLAPALLGVQPSTLVFDPVDVGLVVRTGLTVTNRGDRETEGIAASIATATPSFSISSVTCRAALAPGESCELDLTFAPTIAGPHSGTLRLTSTPAGAVDVPISGTGAPSPGNVGSFLLLIATQSTDFGSAGINASATRPFTLRNTGNLSAGSLLGFEFGGSFSLATRAEAECEPGVTLLDGGARCDFRVIFQPALTGRQGGSITVRTSIGGTAYFPLSGAGTDEAWPVLLGSPSSLGFINPVAVNGQGRETLEWTIRNAGGRATEALVFTNSNLAEFPATENSCSGILEAGAECGVSFQLAPTAVGERTALMTLSAGALSVSVAVRGFGF